MDKKCILCNEKIKVENGKLKGTIIKAKNVKGINEFIHVCSHCQKKDNWLEDAKVKGA